MEENTDASKLVKGNTLHQILSTDLYIFCVSSTLKKLYRYKYNTDSEVTETVVFKRVKNEDLKRYGLSSICPKKCSGTAKPFDSKQYDVCKLISDKVPPGYMLRDRTTDKCEKMYFVFEKYEKKGS